MPINKEPLTQFKQLFCAVTQWKISRISCTFLDGSVSEITPINPCLSVRQPTELKLQKVLQFSHINSCLSVYLSIYPSFYQSVCLSVYLSSPLSIYPLIFLCLCVCVRACVSAHTLGTEHHCQHTRSSAFARVTRHLIVTISSALSSRCICRLIVKAVIWRERMTPRDELLFICRFICAGELICGRPQKAWTSTS